MQASEQALLWEKKFIEVIEDLREQLEDDDFNIYYNAGRSYGDISASAMFQDINKLFLGGVLMFALLLVVLSKFSWIEFRGHLGSAGLLCVGLAYASTVGLCSIINIPYGPVHNSLPFLLMGLGVDDVFVLMACWRKVEETHHEKPINVRMALMMEKAGVSITVTSLTDIVAFFVGATTILPSLQSFCLYAAIGVFFTYVCVATFFVAIFTLDQRRIAARRSGLIPCKVYAPDQTGYCCELNLMTRTLHFLYSKIILSAPGKVIFLLLISN